MARAHPVSSALAAAASALAVPALAHHSDAALDMSTVVSLEGEVGEFSWRNPHAYFTVATVDDAGRDVEWTIQMPSPITLSRRGWSRDSLTVGERVTVHAHPARDGRPYALFQAIDKTSDAAQSMSLDRSSGELRFTNPVATARTATIEGRWMADTSKLGDFPGGLDNLTRSLLTLTDAARAAQAAYDENSADNPELRCIGRPTPAMIIYTNLYPMEIEFGEDREVVWIRSQFFDEERTVYMDGRAHPDAARQRFHEGHSIGWWEDGALVVDTANFADHRSPYQNGIPSGAQKHVVERYRLNEDGTRLTVEFVLEDPEYIVEPLVHSRELVYSPQADMSPFDCDLETTRRFLPR